MDLKHSIILTLAAFYDLCGLLVITFLNPQMTMVQSYLIMGGAITAIGIMMYGGYTVVDSFITIGQTLINKWRN
jgi:hypothetical protein